MSSSHLQIRPFVLCYSRTTAENSLSPVSLLLSQRYRRIGSRARFRVAQPSLSVKSLKQATSPTKPLRRYLLVNSTQSGLVGIIEVEKKPVKGLVIKRCSLYGHRRHEFDSCIASSVDFFLKATVECWGSKFWTVTHAYTFECVMPETKLMRYLIPFACCLFSSSVW